MGCDLTPVQPHGGAIVDRLKAEHPVAVPVGDVGGERVCGEHEVPPIPADRPGHARAGEVARVIGVRNRRGSPPVGRGHVSPPPLGDADEARVGAIQPRATKQVAVPVAVAGERSLRRRGRHVRRALSERPGGARRAGHQRDGGRQSDHACAPAQERAHRRLPWRVVFFLAGLFFFFGFGFGFGFGATLIFCVIVVRLPARSLTTTRSV